MKNKLDKGIFTLPHTGLLMEYFLIGSAFWWSFLLLFPVGTFTFATGGSFILMQKVAPLSVWGVCTTTLSAWLLVSLIMRWPNSRKVMLFLHFLWWSFLTFVIVKTNPFSTGTGVYALMALMSLYMALNRDLLPVIYRSTEPNENDKDVD